MCCHNPRWPCLILARYTVLGRMTVSITTGVWDVLLTFLVFPPQMIIYYSFHKSSSFLNFHIYFSQCIRKINGFV
jgi:hypothetical protein